MKSSTVACSFVHNMLAGAIAKGYDANKLLRDSGISPSVLQHARSRITFRQLSALSLALVQLLNDENYGLTDKPQHQNTFKLICYSIINGDTVQESLQIYVDFLNILEGALACEMTEGNGHLKLQLIRRPGRQIKNHYAIEHLLLVIHRTLCWLANTHIPILRADLDYPEPDYSGEYRYIFYGAPCSFNQQHSAITIAQHFLKLQNVRGKDDLKQLLKRPSLMLLSQTFETNHLTTQVRIWLERQLTKYQEAPTIEAAAEHFELHPQAMRRQLKREDSSYQYIKMEIRRDLAINLISHQKHSIEAIAFQLGFSESRAFIRSFKSWTGLTPLAYKKLSQLHQS